MFALATNPAGGRDVPDITGPATTPHPGTVPRGWWRTGSAACPPACARRPARAGGITMEPALMGDSVDAQAAYIALVLLEASARVPGSPMPKRIRVGAADGTTPEDAASQLASIAKPVHCHGRIDEGDLLIDCVHTAAIEASEADTAGLYGADARRILRDLSNDRVLVSIGDLNLLVVADAVVRFNRDYSFERGPPAQQRIPARSMNRQQLQRYSQPLQRAET